MNTVLHHSSVLARLLLMTVLALCVDNIGFIVQVHALGKLIAELVHIVRGL